MADIPSALRQAGNRRLTAAAGAALKGVFGHLGRTLHLLWLEIAGAFFFVFAVVFALAAGREHLKPDTDTTRLALSLSFTILFAWFAGTSFWRARRKH